MELRFKCAIDCELFFQDGLKESVSFRSKKLV